MGAIIKKVPGWFHLTFSDLINSDQIEISGAKIRLVDKLRKGNSLYFTADHGKGRKERLKVKGSAGNFILDWRLIKKL